MIYPSHLVVGLHDSHHLPLSNTDVDASNQDNDVPISFQSLERVTGAERQDHIALELNAVHLWGIELDGSASCLARCREWLDEQERDRAARRVRTGDREQFVFAHAGLRAVLSRYLGIAPDLVAFDLGESGKPMLTEELRVGSAITFNMSHAHGRALVAVSRAQEVGIDLELARSNVQAENLSKRFFSHSEHTAIMQSAPDQRAALFFRYWVAKEAVLKAHGIGLRGLTGCEITFETDGAGKDVRVLAQIDSPLSDTVRVRLLSCGPGWEAAVAAQHLDRVWSCPLEQE